MSENADILGILISRSFFIIYFESGHYPYGRQKHILFYKIIKSPKLTRNYFFTVLTKVAQTTLSAETHTQDCKLDTKTYLNPSKFEPYLSTSLHNIISSTQMNPNSETDPYISTNILSLRRTEIEGLVAYRYMLSVGMLDQRVEAAVPPRRRALNMPTYRRRM